MEKVVFMWRSNGIRAREVGWQLVPEFRISQDVSRAQVLDLAQDVDRLWIAS